jgi:hypothetical protein
MTGLLLALFFAGIIGTTWLSERFRRLAGILFSAVAAIGLVWQEHISELHETWLLLIIFCAGSTFGELFCKALASDNRSHRFKTTYLFGILLGLGISAIPDIKSVEATMLALLIILSQTLLWLLKEKEVPTATLQMSRYSTLFSVIYWGLIGFEMIFWTWSWVLISGNKQTWPMDLVLVAASLLSFRLLSKPIAKKLTKPGYLFIYSIVFMFSLGIAYTLPNPFWFALFFGSSAGIMLSLVENHTRIVADQKVIRLLGLILSISALVMGLYLENHFEYIKSLGLPDQVWLLSARQAWIKEAATLGGVFVLLTGYLYLIRKR